MAGSSDFTANSTELSLARERRKQPRMTMVVIGRQPVFRTLSGRIPQMLDHLRSGHRSGEIQFHRLRTFLETEHNQILPLSLQENVRSPLPSDFLP